MTITWDHENPSGAAVVFVLALAYRQVVGHVTTEAGPQAIYAVSQWTSITETTGLEFRLEVYNWPDATALIQVCARSVEGRYDEECPIR